MGNDLNVRGICYDGMHLGEKEPARDAIGKTLALAPEDTVNRHIKAAFDHTFGEA